jgi:plasmid stabilization system protein ParE
VTSVRYHEAAQDELLQEIAYLELHAGGLGQRFFLEVRRSQDLIARFPASAVEILPGIRKRILRKFPYSLLYTIDQDALLILAVAHHRRRPGYWAGRARQGR